MPARAVAGSAPMATETGMRPSGLAARARRKCSAPCFCVCQCIPVVRSSYTCMRYIPTLRLPVSGLRVNTNGKVMNRPPSCGQHFKIGKSNKLTSAPVRTTSLQSPSFTLFGKNDPNSANFGNILILSNKPCGDSMARNPLMRSATSSSLPTSNANSMRRTLPNVFTSSGTREPFGFSKQQRGPDAIGLALGIASHPLRDFGNLQNGVHLGRAHASVRPLSPACAQIPANPDTPRFPPERMQTAGT